MALPFNSEHLEAWKGYAVIRSRTPYRAVNGAGLDTAGTWAAGTSAEGGTSSFGVVCRRKGEIDGAPGVPRGAPPERGGNEPGGERHSRLLDHGVYGSPLEDWCLRIVSSRGTSGARLPCLGDQCRIGHQGKDAQ